MKIERLTYLSVLVLLLSALPTGRADDAVRPPEKDGTLVVLVTWDDVDKSPATGVYVEVYGFARKYNSEKSFVLKMSQPGRYEGALPPGVYDVFVSESTSTPRCRRVAIKTDYTGYWNLQLEHDDVYLQR